MWLYAELVDFYTRVTTKIQVEFEYFTGVANLLNFLCCELTLCLSETVVVRL